MHQKDSLTERAVSDFRDRIPTWYAILKKFVPDPDTLLEIGCAMEDSYNIAGKRE